MAIVSIKSQNVTFYDADGWILKAPVSTGVKGRETPAGVFAVLQKNIDHRSNLYDDAHMPHMQRLTWNGIAMHGGPLPGYAASHGCVRMPYGFASRAVRQDAHRHAGDHFPGRRTPVDFSHAALLVPNAEAVAAAPARAETLAREAAEAAKAVDETKKAAKTSGARCGFRQGDAAQGRTAEILCRRRPRFRRKGARQGQVGRGQGAGTKAQGRWQGRRCGCETRHWQGRYGRDGRGRCQAGRCRQSGTAEILCRRRSRCRRKGTRLRTVERGQGRGTAAQGRCQGHRGGCQARHDQSRGDAEDRCRGQGSGCRQGGRNPED